MLNYSQVIEIIKIVTVEILLDEKTTPKSVIIPSTSIKNVCQELHQNPSTYFDMLSCITGIDNGPASGTMEVVYNLYSIPFNHSVMLKVVLPRENPEVESVYSIWRGADWLEREVYDMFGINFKDHPDLRRILMPADWEGFPLRKDYKHQEYYRDVKVEY
jgi:NADH-quinone oxidoreductase subunit C